MKILLFFLWFIIFTKIFIFWLWFWQIKEYHLGRFKAHFESQKLRKFLFSFYGVRRPKITGKIIFLLVLGIVSEILFLFFVFSSPYYILYLILSALFIPFFSGILVLLAQIPVRILINRILKKARERIMTLPNLLVVGITGSYGKSSVKEFLAEILSEKFRVLKTQKNINAEVGIARTILNKLKPEHQIFIAEIGAYEKGKIKQVCDIIKPKIGILTGVNEQHLSTFGSLENIKKAKYELIESLPKDGIAILKNKLDMRAEDIKVEKEFVYFRAVARDGDSAGFKVNALGRQNIINILLAASCAKELGMSLEEIARACLKIKPERGGMKFLKKSGPAVIDSSYSANPDGVMADLEYLKLYSGRKIIIMPCLIELNGAARRIHQEIGRKISEICDLAIITTKDYFEEIKKEFSKVELIENPKEIIFRIKEFVGPEDAILLEGRVPPKLLEFLK